MIRVIDESAAIDFYRAAFGMELESRVVLPDDLAALRLRNENIGFELALLVDRNREEPRPQANPHLFVPVADLRGARKAMKRAGLDPSRTKSVSRGSIAFARFFFISDPDGYKIEVLQRGSRFE